MGHLINPIAFRLGHTRSWEDNWYIKNIYYPEFLHSILKIRHYLYYFWTSRYMERKGILLSHFYIFKFIKNLLVKIFLYNIDLEKNIYSFFAKGNSIFSDSFYFRFKKKNKRKEPFSFERYKPELFFLLFLYYSFFSRKKKYIKKSKKNNFLLKRKENSFLKIFYKKKRKILSEQYLNNIKNGDLNFFLNLPDNLKKNNEFLKIDRYEDKIKRLNSKKLNMGYLDFLIYIFFKINMLEKKKEDIFRGKKKRRSLEMILNYPLKIKRWIILLKKYIIINVKLSIKKKRSIKNFIFFLNFIMNLIYKVKEKSGRIKFKLKELNLKLVRIFFFNKILTNFALFYGKFLRHIIYLLTNINKFNFKFCFITNNSVNAKFLARYIGLKLKRKFPLFNVINPLKKELKKLSNKKREKKSNLLFHLFNYKLNTNKISINYKDSFKNILLYLYNKYMEFCIFYYKKYLTFITFDFFIYYIIINKKFKSYKKLKFLKSLFYIQVKKKKWEKFNKKIYINHKWISFLIFIIKKKWNKTNKIIYLKKLTLINSYINNKSIINLLFSFNKYNIDYLASILYILKFDINIFFFINKNLINLLMYSIFFNYNFLNINTVFKIDSKYLLISNYFLQTYMDYLYVSYSFHKFIDYFKINKKKFYIKNKELYKSNSFILGFKMSFKGRFTRKQRASSIWFHQGFVPLNTIKGNIDFAFFTVPLKNSAISIKLWLYKNTNMVIWHSKFLNKK